jgi:hypothetical protein
MSALPVRRRLSPPSGCPHAGHGSEVMWTVRWMNRWTTGRDRGTTPGWPVDRPVDARTRRIRGPKALVAQSLRPLEIAMSPGTGAGPEGDFRNVAGRGRPRSDTGSRDR